MFYKLDLATLKIAIGTIPAASMSTASNIAITGLGFKPRIVKFTSLPSTSSSYFQMSMGAMTASQQYYSAVGGQSNSPAIVGRAAGTDNVLAYIGSTTGTVATSVKGISLDSDGFTIKCNNSGFAFDVAYEAWQ